MGKYDEQGTLSISQIRSFLRCKRQWYLQYYRGLNLPEGDNRPVTVGLLVHRACEAMYTPAFEGDPVEELQKMIEDLVKANPVYEAEIRSAGELALTMFSAYVEWVKETYADVGLQIVAAEERIQIPLGGTGFTLTGRPDARALRMGQKVVIDHKTVKKLDDIPKTAQIDSQFRTYFLIEYLNDKEAPIDSVMVNMFRRVDSNHESSKPPYFSRYEVRYNTQELRSHWWHVLSTAYDIARVRDMLDKGTDHHKAVPPTPKKECAWDCQFRLVCSLMDDGSNVEHVFKTYYTEVSK